MQDWISLSPNMLHCSSAYPTDITAKTSRSWAVFMCHNSHDKKVDRAREEFKSKDEKVTATSICANEQLNKFKPFQPQLHCKVSRTA